MPPGPENDDRNQRLHGTLPLSSSCPKSSQITVLDSFSYLNDNSLPRWLREIEIIHSQFIYSFNICYHQMRQAPLDFAQTSVRSSLTTRLKTTISYPIQLSQFSPLLCVSPQSLPSLTWNIFYLSVSSYIQLQTPMGVGGFFFFITWIFYFLGQQLTSDRCSINILERINKILKGPYCVPSTISAATDNTEGKRGKLLLSWNRCVLA